VAPWNVNRTQGEAMKHALIDGKPSPACPDAPSTASCPNCGGAVELSSRAGTHFWRHKQRQKGGCPPKRAAGSHPWIRQLGDFIIVSGKEREEIGRRSREGKVRAAEQGEIVFNEAPYGYRIVRTYEPRTGAKIHSSVEFHPDEIQAATDIYHWLVYESESLRGIHRRLYNTQVLPRRTRQKVERDFGEVLPWDEIPDTKDGKGRPIYRKVWHRASIKHVLTNHIHTGRWYYNRRKTGRREVGNLMKQISLGERDPEDWICIEVPAVISSELYQTVQDVLKRNRQKYSGRPTKRPCLLRGVL
jgi:site-specific DNA recombinase